jgi:hypothetical protein
VSLSFIVVSEALADFTTATELADRALVADIDWLDEALLEFQRQWIGEHPPGSRLTWKSIPTRARELGIRVRGHFLDDEPGLPDAKAARRAIAYLLNQFEQVDAILLIRDTDNQLERRDGLEQARTVYSSVVRIVLGVAIPERECWVISGFDPDDNDEQQKLASETKKLGSNPCLHSHTLTAGRDDQALRSPKRVLSALTNGDWDRERKCWQTTPLSVLDTRGQNNGLAGYLKEIRDLVVPLISGREGRSSNVVG